MSLLLKFLICDTWVTCKNTTLLSLKFRIHCYINCVIKSHAWLKLMGICVSLISSDPHIFFCLILMNHRSSFSKCLFIWHIYHACKNNLFVHKKNLKKSQAHVTESPRNQARWMIIFVDVLSENSLSIAILKCFVYFSCIYWFHKICSIEIYVITHSFKFSSV